VPCTKSLADAGFAHRWAADTVSSRVEHDELVDDVSEWFAAPVMSEARDLGRQQGA